MSETSTQVNHGIWIGDAWDLATRIPAGEIDLILTSPPYWGLRSYGHEHNPGIEQDWQTQHPRRAGETPPYEWYRDNGGVLGLEPYPEWFIAHLVELFDRLMPALSSAGSVWVNLGDTYFARWSSIRDDGRQGMGKDARVRRITPSGGIRHDKQLLMVPARFAIAMQDRGWILRNDVIWSKSAVAPRPERDRLRLSHEHFFHFVKRRKDGRPSYYYDLDGAEAGGLDVVSTSTRASSSTHSATFPLELIRPRILSSSPAGGTVLDPFSGSGTTVRAARLEGRSAIGFELSEYHGRESADRLGLKWFTAAELDRRRANGESETQVLR